MLKSHLRLFELHRYVDVKGVLLAKGNGRKSRGQDGRQRLTPSLVRVISSSPLE